MLRMKTAKLASLSFFVVGFIAISLTNDPLLKTAHAFSRGPGAGLTGAPGEQTCTTCHAGALNSGRGQLTIEGPATYEPGKTYQVMVKQMSRDSSRRRWGFQLTALNANNERAGNLQNLSDLTLTLTGGPGSNRQYIEHSIGGTFQGQSQAIWSFNWTAPSDDVGAVIFYAAGNQADNNGAQTGDQIYTTLDVVPSGPPQILGASVSGKKLIVTGRNIDIDATLFLNGEKQKKSSNDPDNLTTALIAKKSGKKVERGQTVMLQVKNPDDSSSEVFLFTRPAN